MSSRKSIGATACLAAAVAATALAAPRLSPGAHPSAFCDVAADLGYPSRGYKAHAGSCSSNMIDVTPTPGKNGLKNNLAFYSMGKIDAPSKLQRVSLILNVNNVSEKGKAQQELARVAGNLSTKLVGQVPPDFAAVIAKAGTRTWRVGEWSVEVRSSVWPTGLGQDTTVYFRSAAE